MSTIKKQVQERKYLVHAIYRGRNSMSNLTRVDPVEIVLAYSPFSAIAIASKNHNPDGEKPRGYVAGLILGTFHVNMASSRTYSCEELLYQ